MSKWLKLRQGRVRLDARKEMFPQEVWVRHWHRVLRAAVASPSLEGFRRHVNVAFRNMGKWWLGTAGLLLDSIILQVGLNNFSNLSDNCMLRQTRDSLRNGDHTAVSRTRLDV